MTIQEWRDNKAAKEAEEVARKLEAPTFGASEPVAYYHVTGNTYPCRLTLPGVGTWHPEDKSWHVNPGAEHVCKKLAHTHGVSYVAVMA